MHKDDHPRNAADYKNDDDAQENAKLNILILLVCLLLVGKVSSVLNGTSSKTRQKRISVGPDNRLEDLEVETDKTEKWNQAQKDQP